MHRAAISLLIALATLAAAGGAHAAGSGRTLYKWVDEKGVVHYGDSIPPQYAKQDRRILNDRGVEVGHLEAEKTDAQRTAEQAKQKAVTDARQRDQILLTTYVSVAQIEELRDQRLDMIEGQVKVTTQYVETLHQRLKDLHGRSQFFKPYSSNATAKQMPDVMAEDLVRAVNELRVQERNLVGKRAEQDELRSDFQADIQRYKELKGIR